MQGPILQMILPEEFVKMERTQLCLMTRCEDYGGCALVFVLSILKDSAISCPNDRRKRPITNPQKRHYHLPSLSKGHYFWRKFWQTPCKPVALRKDLSRLKRNLSRREFFDGGSSASCWPIPVVTVVSHEFTADDCCFVSHDCLTFDYSMSKK